MNAPKDVLRSRALLAVLLLSQLFACYRSSKPDPRIDELASRIERLESKNAALEALLPKLEALARAAEELRSAPGSAEVSGAVLEDKLANVDAKLDELERKLADAAAAAPAPAPPPRPYRPPSGPDPAVVYAVPIQGAPYRGAKNAKVTIVEGFEFACPYCERVRATLDQLLADYGKDVKIVYKHFIVHPSNATTPALAACAAHKQGKFKEMHDLIWAKGYHAGRNLDQQNMETLATEIGLDLDRFRRDQSGACKDIVAEDQRQLAKLGMRGTPSFYINGRYLSGARPIDQFKTLIDEELAKANERIRKGTSRRRYYETWVLKKGVDSAD